MVTRKSVPEISKPITLQITQTEAKNRLEERIEIGKNLLSYQISSTEDLSKVSNNYQKWDDFNNALLKQIFTTDEIAKEYGMGTTIPVMIMREPTLGERAKFQKDKIEKKIHRLDSILERLTLFPVTITTVQVENKNDAVGKISLKNSKKVFIVHGRDDAAKANLEAFLREIGLEPIVLHRQADGGMTVIEKFEKHSDVRYAFILLTPDEIAYLNTESIKPDDERKKELRARPNVIFEWGYFVGKLSRANVCCISTGDVKVPSDMDGLVTKRYTFSVEEVAYAIIKDLHNAGIDAKMNSAD